MRGWRGFGAAELWKAREILFFLTWRDISVRYKQTLLGAGWAILQPALSMIVFTMIFGHFAKVPSDGVPYSIFSLTGLLPWQLFAAAVTQAGNSLIGNQALLTKVYVPRLVFPLSSVLASVADFAVGSLLLIPLFAWNHIVPGPQIVLLPIFVLLAVTTAYGAGLWLSAMNVQFRDIRYTIPFLLQLGLYTTPVLIPVSSIPEKWRFVIGLNPMAGVVSGFRYSLLGGDFPTDLVAVSVVASVVLLVTGTLWFRRMERYFADSL